MRKVQKLIKYKKILEVLANYFFGYYLKGSSLSKVGDYTAFLFLITLTYKYIRIIIYAYNNGI